MSDPSVAQFWDKYIAIARLYKVKESALRWYVRHAETYIAAMDAVPITDHEIGHLESFLRDKGRNPTVQGWQFLQIVQALKILFVDLIQAPWAAEYAWRDWEETARTLPDNHATLSRAYHAPFVESSVEMPVEDLSLTRKVAHLYPRYIEALITQIRVRQYAIRTEQAYLGWLCRFIAYHDMRDPGDLGAKQIGEFIEQLALKRDVAASTQGQALSALVEERS